MYLLNFDWLFFQVPVSSSGVLDESAMVERTVYVYLCRHAIRCGARTK